VSGRDEPVPYREVLIGAAPTGAVRTAIRASQLQGGRPLLVCSLASDRTEAAALVGQVIFAEREMVEAAARAAGAVLWAELAGALVVDARGQVMGRVHHVYNAGASDVAHVRDGDRSVDVPLVDAYVDVARPLRDGRVVLKVDAAVFAGVWDDQTARTKSGEDA
jgi:ribosomal 30S subunit maturation factor RimM